MKSPVRRLRILLKKDDIWLRYSSIQKSAYLPEFDAFVQEIKDLHKTRTIRVLGVQAAPSGKKIADASMKDQAVRSRCVEICMDIASKRNSLAIAMDTVKSHVSAEYQTVLVDMGVRTIADRNAAIDSLFGPAHRILMRLDTITQIADLVIHDVDQAGFALKHTVTALEVATKREFTY